MRSAPLFLILSCVLPAAAQDAMPSDVAAMHPEGKWRIRRAELYHYLVRYHGRSKAAAEVLTEYMTRRLVEAEARKRRISVTEAEVDRWLEDLDRTVRARSGGETGLESMCREMQMSMAELRRKGRQWVLQRNVAEALACEKDPAREKSGKKLSDESVIFMINTLYQAVEKETDARKLPEGTVARVADIDITEYEYGRALSFSIGKTELFRALNDLVLVEAVNLEIGPGKPNEADLAMQKRWFLEFERNRIARMPGAPSVIPDSMIEDVLEGRGLTLDGIYENPAFLAQARVRGHFRRKFDDAALKTYYESNEAKYGARVRIARILIGARAQQVPGVGRKIRNLQQGKSLADALWIRLNGGTDFAALAHEYSDDADVIKEGGGIVPIWLTGATRGYEQSFQQAMALTKAGDISKPFFDNGRGFVIVKLIDREPPPPFESIRDRVRGDAGEEAYVVWKAEVVRAALKNEALGEP
jgi:hypothetical protein